MAILKDSSVLRVAGGLPGLKGGSKVLLKKGDVEVIVEIRPDGTPSGKGVPTFSNSHEGFFTPAGYGQYALFIGRLGGWVKGGMTIDSATIVE